MRKRGPRFLPNCATQCAIVGYAFPAPPGCARRARLREGSSESSERKIPPARGAFLSLFAVVPPFPVPLPSSPFPLCPPLPPRPPFLPRYSSRGATSCVYARPALCDRAAIFPCDRRGSSFASTGGPGSSGSPDARRRRAPGKLRHREPSAERRPSSVAGAGGGGERRKLDTCTERA